MAILNEIVGYCNELLSINSFQDYCPNGLQVEGASSVKTIVSGVTASQALVDAAVKAQADLLLVHHGYFWKGEALVLTGLRRQRIKTLLCNNISLLAYHLPLDAHSTLGNNACLAQLLGLQQQGVFGYGGGPEIACYGELSDVSTVTQLTKKISQAVNREPLVISSGPEKISRIGWCTGAAQSYIEAAADLGLDAFISGEISEQTVHVARECGIHYFAAGHHATERFGVQALGKQLAGQFAVDHQYIEIENPV
ncbi:MAG: Nif3-like dinuclear metal center hexameric protein [Gammaproteobacteria bacterium]